MFHSCHAQVCLRGTSLSISQHLLMKLMTLRKQFLSSLRNTYSTSFQTLTVSSPHWFCAVLVKSCVAVRHVFGIHFVLDGRMLCLQ
jgi:hypothetical protein